MELTMRVWIVRVLLTCVLGSGSAIAANPAAEASKLKTLTPKPAPALSLQDMDGKNVKLSDYRGKVVLVNFWATYCAPCRTEMPAMNRVRRELAGKGFEILSVDIAENVPAVRKFMQQTPIDFPVLMDAEGKSMKPWNAIALPSSYLIDRKGRLRASLAAAAEWDAPEYKAAIQALLDEK
jgi:peroxiredoxin